MPSAKPVGCDSSLLIPALSGEHEFHSLCRQQLSRLDALPAHVLLETYSSLTGMRDGYAVPPSTVAALFAALSLPVVQLPAEEYVPLTGLISQAGRSGGAIYDAQIAAAAKHHGLTLLTRDRRAIATYVAVGVEYELV